MRVVAGGPHNTRYLKYRVVEWCRESLLFCDLLPVANRFLWLCGNYLDDIDWIVYFGVYWPAVGM